MKLYLYVLATHDEEDTLQFQHTLVKAQDPEDAYDKGNLWTKSSGRRVNDYVIDLEALGLQERKT